jgi:hypothetical protein
MGCHTWFKKRIKTPTELEMREVVDSFIDESVREYELALSGEDMEEREFIKEFIEGEDELTNDVDEFCLEQISLLKGKKGIGIPHLEEEYIQTMHTKYRKLICKVGDCWYETIDEFFDVFRSSKWDTQLHSLEETSEFINIPGNARLDGDSIQKLGEFWKKYPDGMIELG